jgi:hypothetical protein
LSGDMGTERDLDWFTWIMQLKNGFPKVVRIIIASELKPINL